jgi:hypothetical protein
MVTLYKSDNSEVDKDTTDASGIYGFTGLLPGDYYLTFTKPSGYSFTKKDQGTNDAKDSDPDPSNGKTTTFTLNSGDNDLTRDAGLYKTASVGDLVWKDLDYNGIQDGGSKTGIKDVIVKLYKSNNSLVDKDTTDASGIYGFSGLLPGDYYLIFTKPAGYSFTKKDQGTNDVKDSDTDPANGKTATFTLKSGDKDLTRDAGLYPPASVSDFVWNDVNRNGLQDGNEKGVKNVFIKIFIDKDGDGKAEPGGDDGAPLDSTYTDSTGYYIFSGLLPNKYFLLFTLPSSFQFTPNDKGTDDTIDSDVNRLSGITDLISLKPGDNNLTVDAGVYQTSSLGDFVWIDHNKNGIQNSHEKGINNITVKLYLKGQSSPTVSTKTKNHPVTGKPGYYRFTNLFSGNYIIKFFLPAGYDFSPRDKGSKDTIDSDARPTNGRTTIINLPPGVDNLTWDAGIHPIPKPGSIGDYVWHDEDGEGDQDHNEKGIPNVIIQLLKGGNIIATDTTDTAGYYDFLNLKPGIYIVNVVESTLPNGYFLTTNNEPDTVDLKEGQDYDLADFGYRFFIPNPEPGRRYILARYQPWFGNTENDSTLRHWDIDFLGGQADTSLFEFYDSSYDPKIWEYHILLAWGCGIDGFAVDWYGKYSYENRGIKGLLNTAHYLNEKYDEFGFNFEIAVSYNERAKDSLDINFEYIGDSLMTHPAYWGNRRKFSRPLFLFNYQEDTLITPPEYRACGDTTLPNDYFLLWNGTEQEVFDYVDVCYPWVQPPVGEWDLLNHQWDPNGMEWGEFYLDSTYLRMNILPDPGDLRFACGSVWPGLDDRKWALSLDHYMDRQDTLVYEATWEKVHTYNYSLPMPWCLVETWNDFNQATEIEPGIEHDYKFNVLTRDNARIFKGSLPPDSVGVENLGLLVPQHIHQARIAAEIRQTEAAQINKLIEQALDSFFVKQHLKAISLADRAAGIAPKPFTINEIDFTSIELFWDAAKYANNYNIYYSPDLARFEPCAFKQPNMISVGNILNYTLTGLKPGTRYYIAVTASDTLLGPYANDSWYANIYTGANVETFRTPYKLFSPSAISEEDNAIPKTFSLLQNYPNPFNPVTTIQYTLPEPQHVVITVFDIQGREVITLVDEQKNPGYYSVNVEGTYLSSGTYFYKIETAKFSKIKKLTVIK